MLKLFAVISNESKNLWRDKAGLLVLFVMPSALVLVITLVQENVMKTVGESETRLLFVDRDRQMLSHEIENKLNETGALVLVKAIDGQRPAVVDVKKALLRGDYQAAIVIPPGATESLRRRTRQSILGLLENQQPGTENTLPQPTVDLYFDPTVMGGFRSAIRNSLDIVLLSIEIKEQLNALSEQLPGHIAKTMQAQFGSLGADSFLADMPSFKFNWKGHRLLHIMEISAAESDAHSQPTSIQQNVPAWTLFGIFFIAVPIAGSLVKERKNGTYMRLLSYPVAHGTLLAGKMATYITVCFVQMALIGLIGLLVLPALGTPALDMGASPGGILLMAFSAILAAVGYGILLGTITSTYEQVSMLGPITIVIAAAIGGIMVPAYAMPKIMQTLSNVSPLAWALNGFLDVFVRQGNIGTILPHALLLLTFCATCLFVSWWVFFRRLIICGY